MAAGPTIIATVGADTAPLTRDLKRAESSFRLFGLNVGVIIGASMVAATRSVFNFTRDLQDQADTLNMTSQAWQRLAGAFGDDTGPDQLAKAMTRLNQSIDDARNGNPKAIASFEALHVTFQELFELSPEDVLMKMADAAKYSADPTRTLAALLDVLGKSGRTMVPDLKEGSAAIREMGAAVEVMDEKTTASVDRMSRAWTKFWNSLKGAAASTAAGLIFGVDKTKGGSGAPTPAPPPDFSSGPIVHKTPEQEKHDHEAIAAVFKEMAETEKDILDYKKRMNDALAKQKELEREILQSQKDQRAEQARKIHDAKQAALEGAREDFIEDPSTHGEMERRRSARTRDRRSAQFDRRRQHDIREEQRRDRTGAVRHGAPDALGRAQQHFEKERDKIQQDSLKKLEEISKKMDGWVKSQ